MESGAFSVCFKAFAKVGNGSQIASDADESVVAERKEVSVRSRCRSVRIKLLTGVPCDSKKISFDMFRSGIFVFIRRVRKVSDEKIGQRAGTQAENEAYRNDREQKITVRCCRKR